MLTEATAHECSSLGSGVSAMALRTGSRERLGHSEAMKSSLGGGGSSERFGVGATVRVSRCEGCTECPGRRRLAAITNFGRVMELQPFES